MVVGRIVLSAGMKLLIALGATVLISSCLGRGTKQRIIFLALLLIRHAKVSKRDLLCGGKKKELASLLMCNMNKNAFTSIIQDGYGRTSGKQMTSH